MSKHTIEFDQECESCGGTGIYVGFAERDGSAVVCYRCRGEGHHATKIVYWDFAERKVVKSINRVFCANPGIGIGGSDLESFGGMAYQDWLRGLPFPRGSEMRTLTCPAWWYQSADLDLKPRWETCNLVGPFAACPGFPVKAKCWSRWDAENP